MKPRPLDTLALFAGGVFGAALLALGLIHVVAGAQVTRLFPVWPAGLPGREVGVRGLGAILMICGAMIAAKKQARAAAVIIGIVVLIAVLGLHLPRSVRSGNFGDEWLNFFKWLAMAAGAFLVADTFKSPGLWSWIERVTGLFSRNAKWLLAVFMIGAALLHVRFASPISQYYIPAWIPGRLFWTYFTAGTLTAGGIGILIRSTARLAALLTSLMIFLWCLLLHIPRTVAEPRNPAEWCGIFEALAFSVIAFVLAQRQVQPAADMRVAPAPIQDVGNVELG